MTDSPVTALGPRTFTVDLSLDPEIATALANAREWEAALIIANDREFRAAGDYLVEAKKTMRAVEKLREARKAPALAAGREVDAAIMPITKALSDIVNAATKKLDTYRRAVEEERRIAARAAQEAAQAEAQRLREESAAALREGDLTRAGDAAFEAVTAELTPAYVPPPPRVQGLSFTDTWKAEVTDMSALILAVATGEAPLDLLLANEALLNQMARDQHQNLAIPGVRVVRGSSSRATR